jgi:hypothetical protein
MRIRSTPRAILAPLVAVLLAACNEDRSAPTAPSRTLRASANRVFVVPKKVRPDEAAFFEIS